MLIDFWTYSCINCQRTLPHIEAWYSRYARDGLVVVGVHTPEFPFEHVVSDVRAQAASLGVRYPVAIDNAYATWDAYDNEYWPSDYLVDSSGDIRHVHFGEGGYADTEQLIRKLLVAGHPNLRLPPPTAVPSTTPAGAISPETYLGYGRLQYLTPASGLVQGQPAVYHFPAALPASRFALAGTWDIGAQAATAGRSARLELAFRARDIYLVAGGKGTMTVTAGGRTQTIRVGGVPKLYTLYKGPSTTSGVLRLHATSGVQAYDFTFG